MFNDVYIVIDRTKEGKLVLSVLENSSRLIGKEGFGLVHRKLAWSFDTCGGMRGFALFHGDLP